MIKTFSKEISNANSFSPEINCPDYVYVIWPVFLRVVNVKQIAVKSEIIRFGNNLDSPVDYGSPPL